MSKALCSMTDRERFEAVERRIANGSGEKSIKGLGYWAAYDYRVKKSRSTVKSE